MVRERKTKAGLLAVWLLVVAVMAVACSPGSAAEPTAVRRSPTLASPTPTVAPASPEATLEISDPALVARQALANRIGVPVDEIEVVSQATSTVPMGNLECSTKKQGPSRPGMVVAQEVTLQAGGKTYVYHVFRGRAVLCQAEGDGR